MKMLHILILLILGSICTACNIESGAEGGAIPQREPIRDGSISEKVNDPTASGGAFSWRAARLTRTAQALQGHYPGLGCSV